MLEPQVTLPDPARVMDRFSTACCQHVADTRQPTSSIRPDLLVELPLLGRKSLLRRLQRLRVCAAGAFKGLRSLMLLLPLLRQTAQLTRQLLRLRGIAALRAGG